MPMAWKEGRRLAFDIRVRPVRRLLKASGAFAKGSFVIRTSLPSALLEVSAGMLPMANGMLLLRPEGRN
jgi:hypothetical protein